MTRHKMKTSSTPPKFYFRNNRVLNYIKMINHYLKNNPMNWILIGNILFLLILFRISRIGKKYLTYDIIKNNNLYIRS